MSTTIQHDAVAQEERERYDLCQRALLGYGKADVFELNPKWGTWNKRAMLPSEAAKITKSFKENGIRRYAMTNLIPIVVPRPWINVEKLSKGPVTGGNDLPDIVWTSAVGITSILGATGQHRTKALEMHRDGLIEEKKRVEGVVDQLEKDDDPINADELAEARETLGYLKATIETAGMWGFAIYDYGAYLNPF